MKIQYRGLSYDYTPPLIATEALGGNLNNIERKTRWLFLKREKSSRKRTNSMLIRSAQEIGLIHAC